MRALRCTLVAVALIAPGCGTDSGLHEDSTLESPEDPFEAGPEAGPEAETSPAPGPDTAPEMGPDTEPEMEPDTEPEPEPGTELDPEALEDAAAVVSAEFPEILACSGSAVARVQMRNTGTAIWSRAGGYKLGAVDDSDPLYDRPRVWLTDDVFVAPGEVVEFEIPLTAPGQEATVATDWRMVHEGVRWFGEQTEREILVECGAPPAARAGRVRLGPGGTLVDDGGAFNALGTTLMWAAWAFKFDLPKLERTLQVVADNGFHYIRALGTVGDYHREDYWDGREIDWHWPDYDDVIAGLTDLAYDRFGLRIEWTLIGDGQLNLPDAADRVALVDRFLAMSTGREHKIMHFEIANEAWQNGFWGDEGIEQLRALTAHMADRTEILVAASAPAGNECSDYQRVYSGSGADIATIHFDRTNDLVDGGWRPVRQPWELQYCDGVPTGSNNEPIGPGSSVSTEEDPARLVAAAINTYMSGLPMYVFHTGAGVRGDTNLQDMAGLSAFRQLATLLPADLVGWSRRNAHWADSPFVVYAEDDRGRLIADNMWPDLDRPQAGVVRAYGAVSGAEFVVAPIGVLDHVTVEARAAMRFEVFEPISGARLAEHQLAAGERVELSGGDALLIRGRHL